MKRLLSLLALCAQTSCIIATSPNDYPPIVPERPTIIEGSVVPSNQRVLGAFPSEFLVPVRVLDVQSTFEWRVFVDFDPLAPNENAITRGTSAPGQEDTDPENPFYGIRRLHIQIAAPSDLSTCHTIQLQVGASFARNDARTINAGDPLQRDQITWFYSPGGDLAGCPTEGPAPAHVESP